MVCDHFLPEIYQLVMENVLFLAENIASMEYRFLNVVDPFLSLGSYQILAFSCISQTNCR